MAIKVNIRKVLFLSLWVVLGTGLLVLLVAAITKKNHATCKGVAISIKGGSALSLDRQDILNVIAPGKNNPYKGRPLASFDLNRLEELLKRDVWVRDADLFFDGNGLLRVNIDEREPIARVFTESGNSFYLDSSCAHLPLSDKMAIRLPVFTGFPSDKTVLRGADSLLQQQVKQLSLYMTTKDTFWLAQVQQVAITPARGFEMIPVIGNHVIEFGDGSDLEAKFHRLLLFYQQVAARVGFDKYSTVDVQYKGQVIGTKKGTVSKVDSLQALKNVQKMIEASKQVQPDTLSTIVDNNIMANGTSGSILPVLGNLPPSPHPVQKPAVKPPVKPKQQPRAVMRNVKR